MSPEEILDRAGQQLSVRRVFGEPVERDGVVLVPVAVAVGGGGGGSGPDEQGSGGGLGGMVRGIGAYVVTDGGARFVPAVDVTALAALGSAALCLLVRRGRRRSG